MIMWTFSRSTSVRRGRFGQWKGVVEAVLGEGGAESGTLVDIGS